MDELEKLEHLSLVSKVCTELDNHLGLNDKDLAEFIIALAEKHPTYDEFKAVMLENGGEFSDSLIANLLRLIKHMKSASSKTSSNVNMSQVKKAALKPEIEKKRELFPGLAIPDDPKARLLLLEDVKPTEKDVEEADDLMAELEAMAPKDGPSHSEAKPSHERAKQRSRSRDRKRSRSKEKEKKRRSR